MNEKEGKIFDIQKEKFETFKLEIIKYDNIYNEIEEKFISLDNLIKETQKNENLTFNRTYMIFEDYTNYNQEILINKEKILELKENLASLEKTYPKEFDFLLVDIKMEKELNDLINQRSIKKYFIYKYKFIIIFLYHYLIFFLYFLKYF
jgi:hypothetical protein